MIVPVHLTKGRADRMNDKIKQINGNGDERSKNMFVKISALDLDMLKEVANIGAGNAATALSKLTGQ